MIQKSKNQDNMKSKFLNLIVILVVSIGSIMLLSNVFIKPTYQLTSEVILGLDNEAAFNSSQLDSTIIPTYEELLKSQFILSEVQKKFPENSIYDLKRMLKIQHKKGAKLFSIELTTNNLKKGEIMLRIITETFSYKLKNTLGDSQKVTIVLPVTNHVTPIFPNQKLNFITGIGIGTLIWCLKSIIKFSNFGKNVKYKSS